MENEILEVWMVELIEAQDNTFEEEVLKAKQPVLVDFSAPWCGPCKMIDPILKDLAGNEWQGKVKVVKINVDENPDTVAKCGVRGLPTLLLFKNGQVVPGFRIAGYKPKKDMLKEVETHL